MDSITQGTLGAGVAGLRVKKLGKKVIPRGIFIATIPDLDVFIGPLLYGDTLQAEIFHRGFMHSIFFCLLMAPILATFFRYVLYKKKDTRRTRCFMSLACLITHPFLDMLTSYGTQIFLPFSDYAVAINSISIIDPLYTFPFLFCLIVALFMKKRDQIQKRAKRGVIVSSFYLVLGLGIKASITPGFSSYLEEKGYKCQSMMTNPEMAQIMLRKAVAICDDKLIESWHSIRDEKGYYDSKERDYKNESDISTDITNIEEFSILKKRAKNYFLIQDGVFYDMRFGRVNGRANDSQPSMFGRQLGGTPSGGIRPTMPEGFLTERWGRIWGKTSNDE